VNSGRYRGREGVLRYLGHVAHARGVWLVVFVEVLSFSVKFIKGTERCIEEGRHLVLRV